ncbi:DUF916 and DUF3324 domain-containing protein [Lactococcus garvieae]|uniref:DUF916 and DUF3324 domain-containing protein n=1 Tax=Lactococcus garvieae TaxID=1363 RepID=UPI0038555C32
MFQIKKYMLLFLAPLLLFVGGGKVLAEGVNFSIVPQFPDTQTDKSLGYFDLLMKPGETQDLIIKLSNTTDKEVTVNTTFSNATTADSGLAVYIPTEKKDDASLKYNISDYVQFDKQVKVPAKSNVDVKAKVKMPEEAFQGVMAGGFTFKQETSETDKEDTSKDTSVSVKNEYRYVVALVMRQSEKEVAPSLKLNKIEAGQVNNRNVIKANLENSEMSYLNHLNISSKITSQTDQSVSYSYDNTNMQMAPNSNFNLSIPVSKQGDLSNETSKPLAPGKYHAYIEAYGEKSEDGKYIKEVEGKKVHYKYKWILEKDFEVTDSEAKKLNKSDPTVEKKNSLNWLMIIGLAIVALLLVIIFLLLKRKKEDKGQEE